MFEEQNQKSVLATSITTFIQLFLIFLVLRVCMIGSGFAFVYIPFFDDMCWHIAQYCIEYIEMMQK
jgi:hypothetical protein